MNSEYDIYDYDKSLFFRLLESSKFCVKFEFVQQKQGIIVCPLDLNQTHINSLKKQNDLIDTHLYLPSPYYKNHYIPLNSLIALASNTSTNGNNNISGNERNNSESFMLDHSQKIYLVLNQSSSDSSSEQQPEMIIKNKRTQICTNVKLLSVQTGYTDNKKTYKILIVNKHLVFNQRLKKTQASNKKYQNRILHGNHSDFDDENHESSSGGINNGQYFLEENYDEYQSDNFEDDVNLDNSDLISPNEQRSIPSISHRNSTYMQPIIFSNINDVKTFGQCVDFMHDTVCQVAEDDLDDSDDELSVNNRRKSFFKQKKEKINQRIIGEDLLNEIELFRKTYIILPTHLLDCAKQLEKMHNKYVKKFLKSFNSNSHFTGSSSSNSNLDLMVTIACETTINGVLFPKVWNNIIKMNADMDEFLTKKCDKLIASLKLDLTDSNEFSPLCADFFKIDRKYFLINTKSILKEIKRLPFLNNPFEKLECIKTSVDLLNNELTISFKNLSSSNISDLTSLSIQLTSDLLIPLVAFILLKSNINCFKSILFFMETFQFSMRENSCSNSHTSTILAELSFFMTTFKAAIQLIETSII